MSNHFIYFSNTFIYREKKNNILTLRNLILLVIVICFFYPYLFKKKEQSSLIKNKSNFTQTENEQMIKKDNICYPLNPNIIFNQCSIQFPSNELVTIYKLDHKNITIGECIEIFLENPQIETKNRKCFSEKLMFKILDLENLNCIEIEQNIDEFIPYKISFSFFKITDDTVKIYTFKEINITNIIENDQYLIYENKIRFCNNIPPKNLPKMDSLIEISWNKTQQEYFCLKNLYLIY